MEPAETLFRICRKCLSPKKSKLKFLTKWLTKTQVEIKIKGSDKLSRPFRANAQLMFTFISYLIKPAFGGKNKVLWSEYK